MKDEIKEILKNCEKAINEASGFNNTTEKILDCITNLQEENERLKEENKRIFSKVNDDELLISNAMNYAEAQKYKSRCEKAIEYIKNNCYYLVDNDDKNLLNILNGGDEE